MNEEVKEILDKFKIVIRNDLDYMLRTHNCKVLLDYITNLQNENERLKERCDYLQRRNNIINELEKWLEEKQALYGINQQGFSWGVCGETLDKLKKLKEGK